MTYWCSDHGQFEQDGRHKSVPRPMPEHTPSTQGERFVGKCPYGNTTYCDGPTGELMCGAQGEGCSRDFHHARLTRELEAARQQRDAALGVVEAVREVAGGPSYLLPTYMRPLTAALSAFDAAAQARGGEQT